MEDEHLADIGTADHLHDERDTVVRHSPDASPSQVEIVLSKYADSIEGLIAHGGPEMDRYTRGFIAGLRAGEKVAANVTRR